MAPQDPSNRSLARDLALFGAAGFLGGLTAMVAGAVLGLPGFLRDWLQSSTPVFQARVGLVPHQPVVLRSHVQLANRNTPVQVLKVELQRGSKSAYADADGSLMDAVEAKDGDTIEVSAPSGGKLSVGVRDSNGSIKTFEVSASQGNSNNLTVFEPQLVAESIVDEGAAGKFHRTRVKLDLLGSKGEFWILEQ